MHTCLHLHMCLCLDLDSLGLQTLPNVTSPLCPRKQQHQEG